MVWTKQTLGVAAAVAALAAAGGGATGFLVCHSQHHPHSPGTAVASPAPSDSESDDQETPDERVPVNGRRAGTRFLARPVDSGKAEVQKKETAAAVTPATNTPPPAVPAETGTASRRGRPSRRSQPAVPSSAAADAKTETAPSPASESAE